MGYNHLPINLLGGGEGAKEEIEPSELKYLTAGGPQGVPIRLRYRPQRAYLYLLIVELCL